MINSMPRTKEEVVRWFSGNENDEDEDVEVEPVPRNPKLELLPSTAKELYNRFKLLHCQFLRHGKYENRKDFVFLLNEVLRRMFITQEDYQKAVDTLDIEMMEEEELKEDEGSEEVLKRLLGSTMDYYITHDKEELKRSQ